MTNVSLGPWTQDPAFTFSHLNTKCEVACAVLRVSGKQPTERGCEEPDSRGSDSLSGWLAATAREPRGSQRKQQVLFAPGLVLIVRH